MSPKMVNFERKKRSSLTLEDKLKILQMLKVEGVTKADIAAKYNLHPTTILGIQKNANSIFHAAANKKCRRGKKYKYVSSGANKSLEDALFLWFLNQRRLNRTVSTYILIAKAKEFAKSCSVPITFKFSQH